MEIGRLDPDSPLGDHIARHRTVDPAGEQKHCLPIGSDRHPARSGNDLRIDIDLVTDLHIQHHVRMMHIHLRLRERLENYFAQITVDLHRSPWVRLPCAPGFHLEGQALVRISLVHVSNHILLKLFKTLILHTDYRTDPHDPEHPFQMLHRILVIIIFPAVHIDPGLGLMNLKLAVYVLQCEPHLPDERVLKQIAVLAFDPDLTVFY